MINLVVKQLTLMAISVMLVTFNGQTSAAWFEAQGQAIIQQGNRVEAKERATEEAIRQALMFAGASVQSVQMLTNGLLSEDSLQVQAMGEVQNLELIDEHWHDDYVTVKIRADIFPQLAQCHAATFQKTLVTTWFPLENRQQAQDGQIHKLSETAPRFLQQQFRAQADYSSLVKIEPYTVKWSKANVLSQAPSLARLSRAQYILAAVITDVSLHRATSSALAFWENDSAIRQFGIDIYLVDGMNGAMLLQEQYRTEAPWEFDRFTPVDVTSDIFWRSQYGQAVNKLFTRVVEDVDQILTCQPATGRVLSVEGDRLQVSLGRAHGIQVGDELTLYKTSQVIDPQGMTFLQYQLYPTKVKVLNASVDSSTVMATGGGVLANIQPNDFVAKQK